MMLGNKTDCSTFEINFAGKTVERTKHAVNNVSTEIFCFKNNGMSKPVSCVRGYGNLTFGLRKGNLR